MVRLKFTCTLLLLAVLFAPISKAMAMAEEEDTWMRQYLHVGVGAYIPAEGTMGSDSCIEMGYGILPLRFLAFEANIGYLQSQDIVTLAQNTYDFHTMLVSATGTVKAIYPLALGNIYLLAGGGMYYASLNYNGDHAAVTFPTNGTDLVFGYYYGAGAEMHAMKNITLAIEGKKLEVQPSFDKLTASAVSNLSNRDFSGLQIIGRITYNF